MNRCTEKNKTVDDLADLVKIEDRRSTTIRG